MGWEFQLRLSLSIKFYLFFLFALSSIAPSYSALPTPAQIEQFKLLSESEQKQLATELGVELPGKKNNLKASGLGADVETLPRATVPTYKPVEKVSSDNEVKPTEAVLKKYGYDLFNNNAEAFTPSSDIPVPDSYVLGPGDTLFIQLYGNDNSTYNFTISREGYVHFPKVGPLNLAGLTFLQVQNLIDQTVSEQMIGVKSAVTMGAIRSIRVFVLGEAVQPGSYVVSALSTMTNALFSSGGITQIGSLRNIQLKRRGRIVTNLDLYDLLLSGDTRNDSRLLPGDVIFIPPTGKNVAIDGEVRRPAIYELKHENTTEEIITLAGGALPTAYMPKTKIERINEQGYRTIIDVDMTLASGKNTKVFAADKIIVPSVLDSLEQVVVLEGHFKRPGTVSWNKRLRISDIVSSVNQLKSDPELNAALIVRETQPSRTIEVIMFDLGDAIENSGGQNDILLEARDKILVFDRISNRAEVVAPLTSAMSNQSSIYEVEKTVTVSGNVRFPGKYPLIENMNVDQLIELAGGLSQNAYGISAEVTRYEINANQQQKIKHITVVLDNKNEFKLSNLDNLQIKQIPSWSEEKSVSLQGEVMFPGTYIIKSGETLSELIGRAGGLTDEAYPEAAIFTRAGLKELEAKRLEQLEDQLKRDLVASNIEQQDKNSQVEQADVAALLESVSSIKPLGRLVIDLPKTINDPENNDVVLRDGDAIEIPKFKQSIAVVGEVQFPTSHLYNEQLSVKDYINRSGGTNLKADKRRIYIVKADGKVLLPKSSKWFKRNQVSMSPGDTVVVPLDSDRIKSLTLWTNVSEIFYQMALGAAAVASF